MPVEIPKGIRRFVQSVGSWNRLQNLRERERKLAPNYVVVLALQAYGPMSTDFTSHVTKLPAEEVKQVVETLGRQGVIIITGNKIELAENL